MQRGYLAISPDMLAQSEAVRLANSGVLQWVAEDQDAMRMLLECPTKECYERFVGFCDESGLRRSAHVTFSREVCGKLGMQTVLRAVPFTGRKARYFEPR